MKDQNSHIIASTEKAFFETRLGGGCGEWIKAQQSDSVNTVPMFRTTFTLNKKIRSERIYASALGIYEVFINGKKVGTPDENGNMRYDAFKPGWTDYTYRFLFDL